jgi:anti-sigma-K factor RskA
MTGAGFATAAALATILVLRAPVELQPQGTFPTRSQLVLVSSLLPKDGAPLFVASFDAASATIIAIPTTSEPVQDGVPHLWLVPKDDRDPIDLGALAPARPSKFMLAADIAAQAELDASLVITLEAAVVRESDAVRGRVIAHGVLLKP